VKVAPSPGFDSTLRISRKLAPFSREAESNSHKAKANNHVPCTDTWDRIASLAHVENDDPEEADQEISDHNWR